MLIKITPRMLEKVQKVCEPAKEYKGKKITKPEDVCKLLMAYIKSLDIVEKEKERFFAIGLTIANTIKYIDVVSVGNLGGAPVHPREVFRTAVLAGINSIIVAHNHPSGNPQPSEEDKLLTQKLQKAGKILGIKLLDHIIFTEDGKYTAFQEGWEAKSI